MSRPAPLASTVVGVVIERRKAKSQWVDYVWRPVAALPGVPEAQPWTALETDDDAQPLDGAAASPAVAQPEEAQTGAGIDNVVRIEDALAARGAATDASNQAEVGAP